MLPEIVCSCPDSSGLGSWLLSIVLGKPLDQVVGDFPTSSEVMEMWYSCPLEFMDRLRLVEFDFLVSRNRNLGWEVTEQKRGAYYKDYSLETRRLALDPGAGKESWVSILHLFLSDCFFFLNTGVQLLFSLSARRWKKVVYWKKTGFLWLSPYLEILTCWVQPVTSLCQCWAACRLFIFYRMIWGMGDLWWVNHC